MRKFVVVISLLFLFSTVQAKDSVDESDILARRGNGVVTQSAFAARSEKIPVEHRLATLRDGNRVRDLINALLLSSQIASDARDSGFDKDQMVIERMQLAAEAELAAAWFDHYVEIQPAADYEALAHDYYLLNQDKIMTSPKVNVTHILITLEKHSDEEALAIAETVRQQAIDSPDSFDELVLAYSEDPSVNSNSGKFTNVKAGDMVKPFEVAAFALKAGDISEPVRTVYGYHIIRLDAKIAPEQMSFDEVKTQLIEREKNKHDERVKLDYMTGLNSLEVEMTQEALETMVKAQFGEDYVDPQLDAQK